MNATAGSDAPGNAVAPAEHGGPAASPRRLPVAYVYLAAFALFAAIALLNPTPWIDLGTRFPFWLSLLVSAAALSAGFVLGTPASVTGGYLVAILTPYHKTAVLVAFVTGLAMLARALRDRAWSMPALVRDGLHGRGFGWVIAVSVYIIALWAIRLGDSTDGWSLFALTASLLTVPFAVYSLSYLPWTDGEIRRTIRVGFAILAAQATVALLYPALAGQFGQYTHAGYWIEKALPAVGIRTGSQVWLDPDFNTGTLRSAHYLSMILVPAAAGSAAYAAFARRRRYGIAAAGFLLAISLAENSHMLAGLCTALALTPLLLFRIGRSIERSLTAVVLAAVVLVSAAIVAWYYGPHGYFAEQPKGLSYRLSARYVRSHPGRMLLGEGPAAFGSHAARKRLPAVYEEENEYPFVTRYVSPAYRGVMSIVHGAPVGSTMNRAMSGALGIAMEWGVAGTALLAAVVFVLLRRAVVVFRDASRSAEQRAAAFAAVFGFVVIAVSLVFRPYGEYPDVASVAAVGLMVAVKS
jgi:hypothetical protein